MLVGVGDVVGLNEEETYARDDGAHFGGCVVLFGGWCGWLVWLGWVVKMLNWKCVLDG